jgi:putative ABC transport system permease protein
MKLTKSLPYKNIAGKPVRSAVLIILTALLSFTLFAGSITVSGLRTGLSSLENRLGADIMVVPYSATTKSNFDNIVLQGSMGYFYMDSSYFDKVAEREGISQISAQLYLATASAGCCAVPVQIIGFDPETDFTVTPWIKRTYGGTLGDLDIVIGNDLNAFVGDDIIFYGVTCHVAAKLDKTGTDIDTAVYTNKNTIIKLIESSLEKNMNEFKDIDPDSVVSCILINVADGYSVEEVVNDINLHVKKVKAIRTTEMIAGISDSLSGISDITGVLMAGIWILVAVILALAFYMSVNERKKEFAVLRVMGASRGKLAANVMAESVIMGIIGGAVGIALGFAVIFPFNTLIEEALGLPFLMPNAGVIILYVVLAFVISILAGTISAAFSAVKISRIDTALILRGDN